MVLKEGVEKLISGVGKVEWDKRKCLEPLSFSEIYRLHRFRSNRYQKLPAWL